MSDDTLTLTELMLHAEQFCSGVEATIKDLSSEDRDELRLKIVQCRSLISELQAIFEDDRLSIKNGMVRAHFRHLIMALLWIAFRARHDITFKLFRRLVRIESGFTYLLLARNITDNDAAS